MLRRLGVWADDGGNRGTVVDVGLEIAVADRSRAGADSREGGRLRRVVPPRAECARPMTRMAEGDAPWGRWLTVAERLRAPRATRCWIDPLLTKATRAGAPGWRRRGGAACGR